MPPGYDLRTFFDNMRERHNTDLPKRYTFTVSYDDGHGHSWTEANVVDLGLLDDLLFTEVFSVHHVAKTLRELEKHLKGARLLKGYISATVETRQERADREEREWAEHEEMVRLMREQQRTEPDAAAENGEGADTR